MINDAMVPRVNCVILELEEREISPPSPLYPNPLLLEMTPIIPFLCIRIVYCIDLQYIQEVGRRVVFRDDTGSEKQNVSETA